MKKTGHIAIIFLLILGTGGLTINKHYCGNTLVGKSIFTTPKGCCDGPCRDCRIESRTFRITDKFESPDNSLSFTDIAKVLKTLFNSFIVLPLLGSPHANLACLSFPLKGPLIAKVPAGDTEAVLQCFRL